MMAREGRRACTADESTPLKGFGVCSCSSRFECVHGQKPGTFCHACDRQVVHGGDCSRSLNRARRRKRRAYKARQKTAAKDQAT